MWLPQLPAGLGACKCESEGLGDSLQVSFNLHDVTVPVTQVEAEGLRFKPPVAPDAGAHSHFVTGRPQSLLSLGAPGLHATPLEEGQQVPRGGWKSAVSNPEGGVVLCHGPGNGAEGSWLMWVSEQTYWRERV